MVFFIPFTIILLITLSSSLSLTSHSFLSLNSKTSANLCDSPIYIISIIDGKSLDLEPFTCGEGYYRKYTTSKVIMTHDYPTWCFDYSGSTGSITYNGLDGTCGITIYGSSENYFSALFARAHMNWNNLNWIAKALGNGFFSILSPFNNNHALTWDGEKMTLEPFELNLQKQMWILLKNKNCQ